VNEKPDRESTTALPKLEHQEAYLKDPLFHATVNACVQEQMRVWTEARGAYHSGDYNQAVNSFVALLGQYQDALRRDNRYLKQEVTRLRGLITEPMEGNGATDRFVPR
jgi:hypothetical protein